MITCKVETSKLFIQPLLVGLGVGPQFFCFLVFFFKLLSGTRLVIGNYCLKQFLSLWADHFLVLGFSLGLSLFVLLMFLVCQILQYPVWQTRGKKKIQRAQCHVVPWVCWPACFAFATFQSLLIFVLYTASRIFRCSKRNKKRMHVCSLVPVAEVINDNHSLTQHKFSLRKLKYYHL